MNSSEFNTAESADSTSAIFVGRAREIERLRRCAQSARLGHPRLVVVEGEHGVGKTALIRHFQPLLDGFRVIDASCDRSESDLAFSLASRLLRQLPVLDRCEASIADAALDPEQTWLDVGAQLLGLLDDLQREGPVAILVDDVQWADKASREALAFVLRRLWADHILAIITVAVESPSLPRDVHPGVADIWEAALEWQRTATGRGELCRMHLRGLDVPEVTELCERTTELHLSTAAAFRLQRHTGGHPLYLRTLLAEMPAAALDDLDKPLPVPGSLAAVVHRQAAALPAESRALLEAMAVLDQQTPLAVPAKVAGVIDATVALEPLLQARLVDWSPGRPASHVSIRHPLIRKAVYDMLMPGQRRMMHAAAASLVDISSSWAHRVAATDQSDPGLVTELEEVAAVAAEAGDVGKAATWLLWAADLSHDRQQRERLLLTAVLHLLGKLRDTRALKLRVAVEACSLSPLRSCLLGRYEMLSGRFLMAEGHFRDAVAATRGQLEIDRVAATASMLLAAMNVWRGCGEAAVIESSMAMTLDPENPGISARAKVYLGLGRLLAQGASATVSEFTEVAGLPMAAADVPREDAYLLMMRGTLRCLTGSLSASCADLATVLSLRREGAVTDGEELTRWWLANAQFLHGAWPDAMITVSQAFSMAPVETRPWAYTLCHSTAAIVCAAKGDWDRASGHIERAEHWLRAVGPSQFVLFTSIAKCSVAQARGDHQAMSAALRPALDLPSDSGWPRAVEPWWLPLHLESLIGTGRLTEAAAALTRLRRIAQNVPYLRTCVAWFAGWLSEASGDLVAAKAAYSASRDIPDSPDDAPFFRARLEHAYGKFLLGTDGWKAAVAPLRAAYANYEALDATPFLQRCAEDLAHCQVVPRTSSPMPTLDLTERERDIVHLVTRGLTNGEVARELFLSVKTIEYHLGNIYAKLGLKTRKDLRTLASLNGQSLPPVVTTAATSLAVSRRGASVMENAPATQ